MADNTVPGLGELFGLVSGGVSRSIAQFQRGVSEFLRSVENFNKTMEQMQEITARVNSLLSTIEEPIKAAVPQITRAVNTADTLMEQLSGPIDKVTPGLSRLADTLSAPALTRFPHEFGEFLDAIGDMVAKIKPLSQIAESAGGLFGIRPFASLTGSRGSHAPAPQPSPPPPPPATAAPPKARQSADKRAPAKKTAAKKAPTKR